MVSFVIQNPLDLISSHLFIFVFLSITLRVRSKKILLQFIPESLLSMFSFRNFIVNSFTFGSLIYFEFISVYGVREYSNFFFLRVIVQFFQ